MVYIGFSTKTHKTSARILCKTFRHVAPVLIQNSKCVIYQFVNMNKVVMISIKITDLNILVHYGWKFIQYDCKFTPEHALKSKPITCVQFAKRACGIRNIKIQTPDALLKFIK